MNTPCGLDGICPYTNEPTPQTCDVYCGYVYYVGYEYYDECEDEE